MAAAGIPARMRADAAHIRGDTAGALGRIGWLATAVLYALLALLALRVALEGRSAGRSPDTEGALRLVAEQPLGRALLVLLAAGFGAHAVWRLAEALGDRERDGSDAVGLAKRAGYAAIALWYAALACLTVLLLTTGRAPANGAPEDEATRGILGWPLGQELVIAAGMGFLIGSIASLLHVRRRRHVAKLRAGAMSSGTRRLAEAAGGAGYAARALVFAVIGAFLVRAGWEHDPSDAVGLDGALLRLAREPFGTVLLAAVAAGLAALALWALLQARYRAT